MRAERVLGAVLVVGCATLAASGCEDEALPEACGAPTGTSEAVETFSARCSRLLDVETDPSSPNYGRVPCTVYATFPSGSPECACDGEGYAPVSDVPSSVRQTLASYGYCGEDPCCENLCVCEFLQLDGAELTQCQTDSALTQDLAGWCYVSSEQSIGNPEIVAVCPEGEKRLVRIFPHRMKLVGVVVCQQSVDRIEQDGG